MTQSIQPFVNHRFTVFLKNDDLYVPKYFVRIRGDVDEAMWFTFDEVGELVGISDLQKEINFENPKLPNYVEDHDNNNNSYNPEEMRAYLEDVKKIVDGEKWIALTSIMKADHDLDVAIADEKRKKSEYPFQTEAFFLLFSTPAKKKTPERFYIQTDKISPRWLSKSQILHEKIMTEEQFDFYTNPNAGLPAVLKPNIKKPSAQIIAAAKSRMTSAAWKRMIEARDSWLQKYHPGDKSIDLTEDVPKDKVGKKVIEESDDDEEEPKPKAVIEESDDDEEEPKPKAVIEESDDDEEEPKPKAVIEESDNEDSTMKDKEEQQPERRTWAGKTPRLPVVSIVDYLPKEVEEGMLTGQDKVAPFTSILRDTDDQQLRSAQEICHFICNKPNVNVLQPITPKRRLKTPYQSFQKTCRMLYTNSVLQRWWLLEFEPLSYSKNLVIIRAKDNQDDDNEEPVFYLVTADSSGIFIVYDCPTQLIANERAFFKDLQETDEPIRFTLRDNIFAIRNAHEDEVDEEKANALRYHTLADMLSPNAIVSSSNSKSKKRAREEDEEKVETPETESESEKKSPLSETQKLQLKVQELERKIKRQKSAFNSEKKALMEENHSLLRKVYNLTEQLKNK